MTKSRAQTLFDQLETFLISNTDRFLQRSGSVAYVQLLIISKFFFWNAADRVRPKIQIRNDFFFMKALIVVLVITQIYLPYFKLRCDTSFGYSALFAVLARFWYLLL